MQYQIPKNIKTGIKFFGFIFFKDVVTMMVVMFIAYLFQSSVHRILIIPYYLFVFFVTLYFLLPSLSNPQKRNYHTLMYAILRDRTKYHALDINDREDKASEQS